MEKEVYNIKDIMQLMDISKNVAYDLVKQEGFPVIKIKSTYRIPKKAFHDWLNEISRKS